MTISRPTKIPSWATDVNYASGVDPWAGTPTRVEPDSGDKGSGHVPAQRPPAQWLNWLSGLAGDWISWLSAIIDSNEEHTYQTPKGRVIYLSPEEAMPYSFDTSGIDEWQLTGTVWTALDVNADLYIPIRLPQGVILDGVDVLYKCTTGGGVAHDATLKVYKVALTDWSESTNAWGGAGSGPTTGTQLGSTATVVNSSSPQGLRVGDVAGGASKLNEVIAGQHHYFAAVHGDSGAAADELFVVRLHVRDIGPRNG